MGKHLASILTELPPDDRALVTAYETALRRAGVSAAVFRSKVKRNCSPEGAGASVLGNRLWAARRFLQQWGLEGWQALSVEEQFAILTQSRPVVLSSGYRCFVCWLAVTGRQPFSPCLLEAIEARAPTMLRWLEQGRRAWPELIEKLDRTALRLGFSQDTADFVGHAVTKAAAYAGKNPKALTIEDLVELSNAMLQRRAGRRAERGDVLQGQDHQPLRPWTTATVLYHAGLLPAPPDTRLIGRRPGRGIEATQLAFLQERWPAFYDVATRYLERRRTMVRPSTVKGEILALGCFFRWLTEHDPELTDLSQLDRRQHLEPYLQWALQEGGPGRGRGQEHWTVGTRYGRLECLQRFFRLLVLWEWPEAPSRPLFLPGDLPRLPEPLPKAFDDVEAARMVQVARTSADPLERLIIELLAGCGLRVGEARDLTLSDIVTFGGRDQPTAQPWLHVPLGKLSNDRYVPIGPELQAALDAFLAAERSSREWEGLPSPPDWTAYLLARKGRRLSKVYCNQVVHRIAERAGVEGAHAHRWRHTFATQAINRGMDLASIATLLGHRGLEMTMVYARIASPKLRQEFERVSQQVQAFYTVVAKDPLDTSIELPAGALGPAMVVARRELEWRRLGNGWCTRRAYLDCRYELVCERCVHFNTDRLFLPILEAQHEDAARKGQQARVEMFAKLIASLKAADHQVEPLPVVSGPRVADFSNPKTDLNGGLQ
jgi:site-specific recombinase XerD